jgi:hypothetical protein
MNLKDNDAIFPKSFNPTNKTKWAYLSWMPNYNIVFWVALVFLQFTLVSSYTYVVAGIACFGTRVLLSALTFLLAVSMIVFNLKMARHFATKWHELHDSKPKWMEG